MCPTRQKFSYQNNEKGFRVSWKSTKAASKETELSDIACTLLGTSANVVSSSFVLPQNEQQEQECVCENVLEYTTLQQRLLQIVKHSDS